MKRWINICKVSGSVQYPDDFFYTNGTLYGSQAEADKAAEGTYPNNRIDCIAIEYRPEKKGWRQWFA